MFESVSRQRKSFSGCSSVANFVGFQLANQLWPAKSVTASDEPQDSDDDDDGEGADDIEKQIAKEVASMKRPRKETRFGMSPRW